MVKTIQITIDDQLLAAADRIAREDDLARSALIRLALTQLIARRAVMADDRRHREGYERIPVQPDEVGWPVDERDWAEM